MPAMPPVPRRSSLNFILQRLRIVYHRNLARHYVSGQAFNPVRPRIFLIPQTSDNINLRASGYVRQAMDVLPLPCHHIVPAGVNHGGSLPVLVGIVGSNRHPCHNVVREGLGPDAPDHSPEFDSVQLFHKVPIVQVNYRRGRAVLSAAKENTKIRNWKQRKTVLKKSYVIFHFLSGEERKTFPCLRKKRQKLKNVF